MPIRITGLNSGLDTEALVSELVSAYRKKTEKYTKAQTKLTWKQDAWKSLSSKTYSFRTSLDSLRFSSAYKLKTTSVSNSTKATITADNNAVNGTQSLNITTLAKSGYLTGGRLSRTDGKSAASDTTLAALGYNGTGKVSLNGEEISLSGSMTINDAINQFKKAGVSASFDATNQRIFVSSTESGKDNDFSLSAMNAEGAEALRALGLYTASKATTATYEKYETVNKEYEAYAAAEQAAGNTALSRADWLKKKVEDYNTSADTVAKANDAAGYLKKAAVYQAALSTIDSVENGIDTTVIGKDLAKTLLEDSTKYVAANGDVYTPSSEKDENGKSFYTIDGDPSGQKYYYDTVEKQIATGNKIKDENGNEVDEMKTVTVAVFRTAPPLTAEEIANGGVQAPGVEASTANEYLEEHGISAEAATKYRQALSAKAGFEADVQAEQDTYNARVAELEQMFLDGVTSPTADDIAKANEQAIEQANLELKASGTYAGWRSLEAVQNMSADEIAAAQEQIANEKASAGQFIEDNEFFESYAKKYIAAADDTSTVTPDDVVEEMEKDFEYALDALAAERTRSTAYNTDAVRIDGQDATIYLNGAQFTSSSNTFKINGLTINALATTTTEDKIGTAEADAAAVTITTSTDNQGIYDKIKDFLSEYNSLINSMTASYNAESASDYEPLTDDEKESMTDSQIEKWEEKGRSAVLRRDTTLSALMSALTTAMSKSYEINGKKYSLSSFGIKTLGILNAEKNEQNAYHIDGDEDDDSVKGNTDKLMAAIIEDPDAVTEFFQRLTNDVYDGLSKKMSSTSMRTYGTFYNDKEMAKEYSDYTTTISKWEEKLADIEESYYKKFAAMESALATLQSQSSQLAGLLG